MKTKFWDNLIKVVPVVSSDGCWNLQRSGWKKEKGENTCSHVELNYLLALTADVLKGHLNRSSKSCCRKYSHGICELQLLWGPAEMCLLLTINTIHLLSPAGFSSLNSLPRKISILIGNKFSYLLCREAKIPSCLFSSGYYCLVCVLTDSSIVSQKIPTSRESAQRIVFKAD